MEISFVVDSLDISGGTYVVLQHALFLQNTGVGVTIITTTKLNVKNYTWHNAISKLNIVEIESIKDVVYDVVFATWWKTVLSIPIIKAKKYAYFVQSIESKFYSENEIPLRKLVDSTYTLPLHFVTEANWIKGYLNSNYNINADLVINGINKQIFLSEGKSVSPKIDNKLRILIEGPLGVKFKNVARTIKICKQASVGEIWLLTSVKMKKYPGVDRVFSRIPIETVPEIYRSCDVLVKLSYVEGMFGPPLEMFHCGGTAIVYNVSGHDEYIEDSYNAYVVQKHAEKIVIDRLQLLQNDREILGELKLNALKTASSWPSWDGSSSKFLDVVTELNSKASDDGELIKEKIDKIFADYVCEETKREKQNRAIQIKYKIFSLFERLPENIKDRIRQFKYVYLEGRS